MPNNHEHSLARCRRQPGTRITIHQEEYQTPNGNGGLAELREVLTLQYTNHGDSDRWTLGIEHQRRYPTPDGGRTPYRGYDGHQVQEEVRTGAEPTNILQRLAETGANGTRPGLTNAQPGSCPR